MPVGYRSSSNTGGDQYVASIDVPVPSGAAANDIALVGLKRWESGNPTITPPSGFTEKVSQTVSFQNFHAFYKRLTGSDTGSYTFTWSGQQWSQAHCMLVTGAKLTGDPIGSNINNATTAGSTTEPTTSVTVGFDPFLCNFVSKESSALQIVFPASFTEVQDTDYMTSNYRIPGASGTWSAAGGTVASSTAMTTTLIAVEPEPAPAGLVIPRRPERGLILR